MLFGVISGGSIALFRRRFAQRSEVDSEQLSATAVGESAVARERIEPRARGRVELRGSVWTGRNIGDVCLEDGARARVVRVEGLVLDVEPEAP